MTFHFENLSFGFVVFYAVAAVLLCGTWTLILKSIYKNILKRELKAKKVFITLTLILFVFFIIMTLLDKPYELNR